MDCLIAENQSNPSLDCRHETDPQGDFESFLPADPGNDFTVYGVGKVLAPDYRNVKYCVTPKRGGPGGLMRRSTLGTHWTTRNTNNDS
jgi:hypothetical protein